MAVLASFMMMMMGALVVRNCRAKHGQEDQLGRGWQISGRVIQTRPVNHFIYVVPTAKSQVTQHVGSTIYSGRLGVESVAVGEKR